MCNRTDPARHSAERAETGNGHGTDGDEALLVLFVGPRCLAHCAALSVNVGIGDNNGKGNGNAASEI